MKAAISRFLIVGLAGLFAWTALAQGPEQDQSQPPVSDEVVAHLSALSGSVSTQRADSGDWVAGAVNTPLLSGDKVAAGEGSRAEVQIDYADLIRLGDNADVGLVNLSRKNIQVQVGAGLADYIVLKGAEATSEIDTPNIAIYPQRAGVYRVLVSSNSQTQVIVRSGEAEISTPQGSTRLQAGQMITVEGVDSPQYQISDAPGRDSWDQWNETRDRAVEEAQAYNHANRYYTGSQALEGYGTWTEVPGYGQVWVPDNQSGWTPYSDGRWTWEPYWGWTWVSYEPWGWAPYHYGRWFVYGPNWVWWPGPVTPFYQPIWAPAYVSFFGWGGGFGVGVGFGSIGWLPIGPCDPYRPWWGGWNSYNVTYINITNINVIRGRRVLPPLAVVNHGRVAYSNLRDVRTNARVRTALIRVPQGQFARGGIGARSHVTASDIRGSRVLGGTLPVVPTRASLTSSRFERPGRAPVHTASHFFGQRGTVMSRPTFTQERANVQTALRGAPATRTARPAEPARAPAAAGGMQHFESSGSLRQAQPHAAQPRPERPAPTARPGWRSFGNGNARTMQPAQPRNAAPRANAPRSTAPRGNASRPFTPRQSSPAPRQAAPRPSTPSGKPGGGGGWQSFRPQPQGQQTAARGFDPQERAPRDSYRPPLEVGHPIVSAPRDAAPAYHQPAYREPSYRAPAYHAPAYHAPAYHAPAYHAPAYHAPAYHAPAYHAPAVHSKPHVSRGPGGGRPHV